MPPRKKDFIPPEARGAPRRAVRPVARFGVDDDDDDDDDMPLAQSRLLAAEGRLTQGTMMERCGAVLDLMQLRPDAFIFAKPVAVQDVPDYLDVISDPCAFSPPYLSVTCTPPKPLFRVPPFSHASRISVPPHISPQRRFNLSDVFRPSLSPPSVSLAPVT